ncbi:MULTISPECIES: hypothetical protein [unclassified Beijerinckia]|uniref:hypothetical protein n=1 Tax=unclassified Beijerinckia TaxID=2638183 RepID=UPI00089D9D97|nr:MULTISPECIES: hypothetical protein [unclassified Beijerinckia]MDH7798415.1 hypothetical protein [Beijerinckia sp. GAS462]SED20091.1 hypothetical protein SAMN05443249_4712 [Beijerinckia sp. 28-YEA-48]
MNSLRRLCVATFLVFAITLLASAPLVSPASAEVRFGKNVRVGGHDFSNQTFNRKRRAVITLYDRTPRHPGCVWRADGRGGKVKVCHLRRIR